jgi:hypothetical protein
MKLTYGQLELTLASHLHIHPDKVGTLRSRIKQLQRLQFPPGVNVGRGLKMEYTVEHLFMLVTAFELIGSGLPALPACNLVKQHWAHFAAGYALSVLQERELGGEKRDPIVAIVTVRNLHDIQFSVRWNDAEESAVEICDIAAAVSRLHPSKYNKTFTRILLSAGALVNRILEIAHESAGVKDASIYLESFDEWLPAGIMSGISFKGYYPDRSNLELRKSLHLIFANDPRCLTPEGEEEARVFRENGYSTVPF